jgi:hypothetical protein
MQYCAYIVHAGHVYMRQTESSRSIPLWQPVVHQGIRLRFMRSIKHLIDDAAEAESSQSF